MKAEVSHIWVREGSNITCQAIMSDGSSHTSYLPAGRHDLEGYIDQEGRRFLRLRDRYGRLKVVNERELRQQGKGFVRRSYRQPDQPGAPSQGWTHDTDTPDVSPITSADRSRAKKLMRSSIPDFIPARHLGRYIEYGSVDSWSVDYSIERRAGEWIIHCEDPGGERDASSFADVTMLVEDASDRGYRPEDLLDDLRRSGRRHLITLAHEVEEVAIDGGWLNANEADHQASGVAPRPPVPVGTGAHQANADDGASMKSPENSGAPAGRHAAGVARTTNETAEEDQSIGMQGADEEFNPVEMAKIVERLKAEGRLPTFEKLRQVVELVREEWERDVRRIRGLPVPPTPRVN